MPKLTLPPEVGRKYKVKDKKDGQVHTCVIMEEDTHRTSPIWKSYSEEGHNWTYWPDGEAKINAGKEDESFVAKLIEDVEQSEFEILQARREKMMQRLKELEA
jgi:hypothetical protein